MFARSRFSVGAALGGVRHSVVSYGTYVRNLELRAVF
jgi:hypothetical protein